MARHSPLLTWLLVLANLLVFGVELRQVATGEIDTFLWRWGLVAADLRPSEPAALVTLLTSLFLHAGWLHLLSNLLYLVVFGSGVEGVLGSGRFAALYALTGIGGGLAHVLGDPITPVPAVGASGAVAGVIAAHLVLFPGATLGSLAPVLFHSAAASVPALLLLAVWVVAQLFSGVSTVTGFDPGVAGWAHLGGFAAGLVLAVLLRPPRRRW